MAGAPPANHLSHAISRKRLGRLSTNFACRVTDPPRQMFCTSQVRIANEHAHNIFLLYLCRYKTVKNQLFTYGSYRAEIRWVGSRHQVDTKGQTHRGGGGNGTCSPAYHLSHAIRVSRKRLGRLSTNFACIKIEPPTNVLHIASSYRYRACAQHIFAVSR